MSKSWIRIQAVADNYSGSGVVELDIELVRHIIHVAWQPYLLETHVLILVLEAFNCGINSSVSSWAGKKKRITEKGK